MISRCALTEARKRAIEAGRPDLAAICRTGEFVSLAKAQEILSACLVKPLEDRMRPPPELRTLQQAADRLGYTAKGLCKIVKVSSSWADC